MTITSDLITGSLDASPETSLSSDPAMPLASPVPDVVTTPATQGSTPSVQQDGTENLFQISLAYSQILNAKELSHVNEVLDRIQNLKISSDVYDQIRCKADVRFFKNLI